MKNDDVMDLIVVFCILFVFMLVRCCFCVATEFSVNKDLYLRTYKVTVSCGLWPAGHASLDTPPRALSRIGYWSFPGNNRIPQNVTVPPENMFCACIVLLEAASLRYPSRMPPTV